MKILKNHDPILSVTTDPNKQAQIKLEHIKRRLKEYAAEQKAMANWDLTFALKNKKGRAYAIRRYQIRRMIANQLLRFVNKLFLEVSQINEIDNQ